MIDWFIGFLNSIFFIYSVGLLGTLDLLWPLKQFPSYVRWKEEKDKRHEVIMLELKLKEHELLKLEKDLDRELSTNYLNDDF
jgi:hypothetical protein